MQLHSNLNPLYLPDENQSTVLRLGIAPLSVADWIHSDADFSSFHAHKQFANTQHRDKVFVALPGSLASQQKFSEFLLKHLCTDHASSYHIEQENLIHSPTGISWPLAHNSLDASCLWVPDDICLLEPLDDTVAGPGNGNAIKEPTANDDSSLAVDTQKQYRLTAASVCSPSNWKLEEKLGQSLDAIHTPVPGYQTELSGRVNRLLTGLKPSKPVRRFNWSIQPGNELLWRNDIGTDYQGDRLYWRVEQQSLIRMPATDVIIFSIRIFLHSFEDLSKLPEFQNHMKSILSRLPIDQIQYKGLANITL